MILFGEDALRTAIREFVPYYQYERNHQGLGNKLISAEPISIGQDDRAA